MTKMLRTPTADLVAAACKEFDEENVVIEQALSELFNQYPSNRDLPRVLLKVVALNRLYSTQIFAVMEMARHIYELGREVDSALASGSPEIVGAVARLTINGRERWNYSFATKYCSWHNQAKYPIWDSRVDLYLWRLQKQEGFAPFFKANADLWNYPDFVRVIDAVRDSYGLGSFTFKEIDKFLWSEGVALAAIRSRADQGGEENP